ALVPGTAHVDALPDLTGLSRDELRDVHAIGVERLAFVRIADVANRVARHLLEIDLRVAGDLTGQHDVAAFHEDFARDAAARILREMGVEDGVSDIVADLVRMTFADRFRREDVRRPGCRRERALGGPGWGGCWHMEVLPRMAENRNGPRRFVARPLIQPRLRRVSRSPMRSVRGPSNRGNHRAATS